MTPRHFVESLRHPVTARLLHVDYRSARLMEIDAWLGQFGPRDWGQGGAAFVAAARDAVVDDRFLAWLDGLPPANPPYLHPRERNV